MEELEELFNLDDKSDIRQDVIRSFLSNRFIILNGGIGNEVLEDVILFILKFNKEDLNIPKEKRRPIIIFINSPGGNVIAGFNLVDVILSSITPVYTICGSNCCSFGFHIFICGHKRYAFKNSVLLLHEGEVGVGNSSSKAKDTMKFFDSLDKRIKEHVIKQTNIESDFYDSIYEKEYYMYADEEGKSLGCVDYIIGEDVTIEDIFQK